MAGSIRTYLLFENSNRKILKLSEYKQNLKNGLAWYSDHDFDLNILESYLDIFLLLAKNFF